MSNTAPETIHPSPSMESAWRRRLAAWATFFTAGVGLAAVSGFAARWWWGFELASHFRGQYFWGLLVGTALLFYFRRWYLAAVGAGLLALHVVVLSPLYLPTEARPAGSARLRVLSLNVLVSNTDYARTVDFVREADPDIAVFLEVTPPWGRELTALDDGWPYSFTHADAGFFGVAIYSRLPLDERRLEQLSQACPAIVARVTLGGQPVTIFGVHPNRPMLGAGAVMRDRQLKVLADLVDAEPGAKIVVGDMNVTSWSPGFTDFLARSGLRDSRLGLGIQPSWPSMFPALLRIPIDHCLVSPEVEVVARRVGPSLGSDHLPVIADLAIGSARE
ncbi:MAG: hypothetical protein EXS05_08740 [Planctomycetaceae bacterium]|nr:hypothetical protein [Planctomycetaceae bacterium]